MNPWVLSCFFFPASAPFSPEWWSAQERDRCRYLSPLPHTYLFSVGPHALPLPSGSKMLQRQLGWISIFPAVLTPQLPCPSSSVLSLNSFIPLTCTEYLLLCARPLCFGNEDEQKWT